MRPIDADRLLKTIADLDVECADQKQASIMLNTIQKVFPQIVKDEPTIEAEPVNGWISVKDRLPPTGVPVLIYVYNIEEMTVVSLDHDGLGFSNADEWFNIKNIHHWRHLPEPPKEE